MKYVGTKKQLINTLRKEANELRKRSENKNYNLKKKARFAPLPQNTVTGT